MWIYVANGRFDPFNMENARDSFPVWTGQYGAFAFGNGWFVTGADIPEAVFVYPLAASGVPDGAEYVYLNNLPPYFGADMSPWDMVFVGSLLFLSCATRWNPGWNLCAYDFAGMPDPPKVLEKEIDNHFYDLEVFGDTLIMAGVGLRRFRVVGLPVEEESPARDRSWLRVVPFPGGIRLEGGTAGIQVEVRDVLGRRVRRIRVEGVRLLFLPRGVYVLRVRERGKSYVRKILVP